MMSDKELILAAERVLSVTDEFIAAKDKAAVREKMNQELNNLLELLREAA